MQDNRGKHFFCPIDYSLFLNSPTCSAHVI